MFGFLNAAALFAAAAALIPLIIHLFSRRRVKIVEFSSLKHLKAMQRRQVRRLKIRQLLLLLLRMLIILVVVLAFARPTTEDGAVGSHASVSAVILFDNSVSMDRFVADGNLFELAKKRTEQLLETFGQSDQVCLIPMTGSAADTEARAFGSVETTREQLARLSVGPGSADLNAGLDNAQRLLERSQNLNQEIYVVTDRQRSSLPDDEPTVTPEAPIYLVDLPLEDNDDLGIIGVDFGGQLIQPGLDFDIEATVKNYSDEASGDRIASLFLNGNRVAQTDFTVDGQSEATVRFTRSVSRTGFHSGYIEISDDKFTADNRYYFTFAIPENFNLLIVSADGSAPYFNLALVPDQSLSRFWSVKQVGADNLAGINFNDYDVILMAGVPQVPERYVDRLKLFTRRGNALFVVYGSNTDIDSFNRMWSEVTGVVYDQSINPNPSRAGFYTLGSMDMTHPVFSVFGFDQNEPPQIKFYTLPQLQLLEDTRTLMRFTGDRPALVERRFGSGRVLTFTGPTAPEYSDLVGHAFFVPFVSRVAEYLAS
ncbi:VWA domain-containing protein, partial [candidate division GN15 bacterium]|nr:VWA domain-containing protein [candidate division GN15 bacterium]